MAWAARIVVCVALVLPGAPLADSHSSIGGPAPKPKAAEKTTPEPNKDKGAFYVVIDGKPVGPVKDQAVRDLIDGDKLSPDTLVWWEGQSDWTPLKEVKELEAVRKAIYARQAHNAKTYLSGTWSTGEFFTVLPGMGRGRFSQTFTFDYDRNYTYFSRSIGKTDNTRTNSTHISEGTYSAWLNLDGKIQVVYKGDVTEHSPVLKSGSKTQKFPERGWFQVIDANTLEDITGNTILQRQD